MNPTVWRMFTILARSIPRRTLIRSVRCLSQKSPVPPPSSSKRVEAKLPPKSEPVADSTIQKPIEPMPMPSVPTLDFSPAEPSEEAQRTGAMSSKEYKTTNERTRRSRARISLVLLFLGLCAGAVHIGREWEEEELKLKRMVCCSEHLSCHQA